MVSPLKMGEIFSSLLSLCYLGTCCIGRSKISVMSLCPAFSEIHALLLVILLGTLQPSQLWGQVCQLWEMCGCRECRSTPKGCILVTDFVYKTETECCSVWQFWGFGHLPHVFDFCNIFLYGSTRIISLASWNAYASVCLLFQLLLLTGFKSHQLVRRHLNEVTSCETPEYPQVDKKTLINSYNLI